MVFGDLMTNLQTEGGVCQCRGNLDFVLTSTGDLALISDTNQCMRQRIIIWLATPKGERRSPDTGCLLWDYLFQPVTGSMLAELRVKLTRELQETFPEMEVKSVRVEQATGFGEGGHKVLITVIMAGDQIQFMFSADEMKEMYNAIWGNIADS
jgi:phage baseplate assembly protein W